MFKNMWNKIRTFFRDSEVIFLARLQVVIGFVTAVVGVLDWSPLLTLDFSTGLNWKQVATIGGGVLLTGLVTEMARRNRATDL